MTTLPQTLEDIKPAWLSAALSSSGQQVEVSHVSIANAHSGTTGRALINVSYAKDYKLPPQLFVKLPPDDPRQREFVVSTGMGRRETLFYRQLSADCGVRVPHCYFADCDEQGSHYIMLLENLTASGCTFRNASKHYSMDYVRSVINGFAALHGKFMDSPRFASDLTWVKTPMAHPMGPLLVDKALHRYRNEMPPVFSDLGELYVSRHEDIHTLWCRGTPTVVHGDVHDGNLFADGDRAGFLDWALVCRTSGMRDLANFMTGSIKPDDLEAHQRQLISGYHQQLVENCQAPPSLEDLWHQYCWHAAYTWVATATTLAMGDEWQPLSYTRATISRLHRAMENIGTVTALRAAL